MTDSKKSSLFFKKLGQKNNKLVFVHGLLGFWRNFYSISRAFQEDYTCLLYDQRGHGSSPHASSYKLEELAEDLKLLIKSLNLKSVNLVGHSLGGYVSSYLAYKEPQLIERLILVDSSPWPKKERAKEIIQLLKGLPDQFKNRESAKAFFNELVQASKLSQTMSFFLMANLQKNRSGSMEFVFDKKGLLKIPEEVRQLDYALCLKSFKRPVLVLRGEHSKHFSREDFEETKKLNPLIQAFEIADSGHWLHAQQPKEFIKRLQSFLLS